MKENAILEASIKKEIEKLGGQHREALDRIIAKAQWDMLVRLMDGKEKAILLDRQTIKVILPSRVQALINKLNTAIGGK